MINITPLLQLCANCPTFQCEFVPHRIAALYRDRSDELLDIDDILEEYKYLADLNKILANRNELFLQDIRENKFTVEFENDNTPGWAKPLIVRITFTTMNPYFSRNEKYKSTARKEVAGYLNRIGLKAEGESQFILYSIRGLVGDGISSRGLTVKGWW